MSYHIIFKILMVFMKLAAIISGGKDSWYAYYKMLKRGYEITTIITFIPKRKDSYMFHFPLAKNVSIQVKNLKITHYVFEVSGEKEKEVKEMREYLKKIVKKEEIRGLISGAIKSNYQKSRIDKICKELKIKSFTPLWHNDEKILLNEIIDSGFEFLVTHICAEGIEKWKNKIINKINLNEFIRDLDKARCNISGEGGEYETFVIKSPLFTISNFKI